MGVRHINIKLAARDPVSRRSSTSAQQQDPSALHNHSRCRPTMCLRAEGQPKCLPQLETPAETEVTYFNSSADENVCEDIIFCVAFPNNKLSASIGEFLFVYSGL